MILLTTVKEAPHTNHSSPLDDEEGNYQLIVELGPVICKAGNPTKLVFSLYDNTIKRFVSEQYFLHLTTNIFPQIGLPDDQIILVKDISYETLNHDLFIICYSHRFGPLKAPKVMNVKAKDTKKSKELLRPFSVSVLNISKYMTQIKKRMNTGECYRLEPGQALIRQLRPEFAESSFEFYNLPFNIIQDINSDKHQRAAMSIGIPHSYALYNGDVDMVKQNYKRSDKLK